MKLLPHCLFPFIFVNTPRLDQNFNFNVLLTLIKLAVALIWTIKPTFEHYYCLFMDDNDHILSVYWRFLYIFIIISGETAYWICWNMKYWYEVGQTENHSSGYLKTDFWDIIGHSDVTGLCDIQPFLDPAGWTELALVEFNKVRRLVITVSLTIIEQTVNIPRKRIIFFNFPVNLPSIYTYWSYPVNAISSSDPYQWNSLCILSMGKCGKCDDSQWNCWGRRLRPEYQIEQWIPITDYLKYLIFIQKQSDNITTAVCHQTTIIGQFRHSFESNSDLLYGIHRDVAIGHNRRDNTPGRKCSEPSNLTNEMWALFACRQCKLHDHWQITGQSRIVQILPYLLLIYKYEHIYKTNVFCRSLLFT